MTIIAHPELEGLDRYKFGWADSDAAGESARRGLSEEVVRDISAKKGEPAWMLDLRLKGFKLFGRKRDNRWAQILMWPGMQLQKLTTREPDLTQLAVAIAALNAVLAVENPLSASEEERVGMEVVA